RGSPTRGGAGPCCRPRRCTWPAACGPAPGLREPECPRSGTRRPWLRKVCSWELPSWSISVRRRSPSLLVTLPPDVSITGVDDVVGAATVGGVVLEFEVDVPAVVGQPHLDAIQGVEVAV